jgi:hypothetical protein
VVLDLLRLLLSEQSCAEEAGGPTKVPCVTATWWRAFPGRKVAGPLQMGLMGLVLWLGMAC